MTEAKVQVEIASDLQMPRLYAWRELAILGVMLMELSWLTIWFQVLTGLGDLVGRLQVFVVLAVVMALAHAGTRALNYLNLKIVVRRISAAVFLLIAIFFSLRFTVYQGETIQIFDLILRPARALMDLGNLFPSELAAMIVVLFASFRGLNLAQYHIGPLKVMGHFRLGFVMYLLYIIFVTLITGDSPIFMWGLFLSAGLFATGTARVAVFRVLRGGNQLKFDRTWFFGLSLTILGSIGVATILGTLITGVAPIVIWVLVRLFLAVMVLLITPFVFGLVFLLTYLVDVINLEDMALFEGLNVGFARLRGIAQMMAEFASDYSWILATFNDLWLRWGPLVKITLCSGVILLISGLIAFRLRERSQQAALYPDEEVQDLLQREDLLDLLREGLRNRMQGLADRLNIGGRLGRGRGKLAAARIRWIYAQLLDQTAAMDSPRMVAQTPLEYLVTLERCYPSLEKEVGTVTHAYLRVRYGELPEQRAEIEAVEAAWDRIESFGKRLLASQKRKKRSP